MNAYKARFARKDDGARTRADAMRGADVFLGLSKAGLVHGRDAEDDGEEAAHLRARQPRSGDQLPRREGGAARRDRRHRAQRLPEPGQQRARLPVHLPGRARRARQGDQRGDEDRRGARAGGAGARAGARQRRRGLRRARVPFRPRLHHPQAVRHARALVVRAGGGGGGDEVGRGAADRWTSPSTASGCSAGSAARSTRS